MNIPPEYWTRIKTTLRVILGLSLLTFILSNLSVRSIAAQLTDLVLIFILAALIIELLTRLVASLKWYILLRIQDKIASFSQALIAQFLGISVGSFLPVSGVDLAVGYSYYLQSGNSTTAVSSVLMDRIIAVYSTVLFVGTVLVFNLEYFSSAPQIVLITSTVLGILAVFPILLYLVYRLLKRQKFKWVPNNFKLLLGTAFREVRDYLKKEPLSIFYNLLLAFVVQILRVLVIYVMALSIGLSPSLIEYTVIAPMIFLFITLPIPLTWLGWEQGIFIVILGLINVSPDTAFTMAIVNRFILAITFIPGIIFLLTGWGLAKRSEEKPQNKEPQNYLDDCPNLRKTVHVSS